MESNFLKIVSNNKTIDYKVNKFPAGEVGLALSESLENSIVDIDCNIHTLNQLTLLEQLIYNCGKVNNLNIGFMYGLRQDKTIHKDYIELKRQPISFNASNVNLLVPHSNVENANAITINLHEVFRGINGHDVVVVFPDSNAKRRFNVPKYIKFITMDKVRNLDAKINKHVFNEDISIIENKHVFVIDDICDGGATFISCAELLNESNLNMKSLNLHVVHGLFTKPLDKLKSLYDTITCNTHPKIKYTLNDLLLIDNEIKSIKNKPYYEEL